MWTEDSILNRQNEYTACGDIFQAFCDELGNHYEKLGMKYSKSRPKITYKDSKVQIELTFNSSRSNIPGKYVAVELGVSIQDLEWNIERNKNGKDKMSVLNNFSLFSKRLDNVPIGTIQIENVFGERLERIEENVDAEFRHNNNFNVYGINHEKYKILTDFLDSKVFIWSEYLHEHDKIKELIENLGSWGKMFTKTDNFRKYIKYKYSDLEYLI